VKQFCEDAKGVLALSWTSVLALSWCPVGEDLLLACTDSNKIVLLNVKKVEVRNLFICLRYLFSTSRWFHIFFSLIRLCMRRQCLALAWTFAGVESLKIILLCQLVREYIYTIELQRFR